MTDLRKEFVKNPALYVIFICAGAMLTLVNRLEGTFARTLVNCEVPVVVGDAYSGSALCGDRLRVIDEGQSLSSAAQGYECFCKVLAMVFVAVMADVLGRKPSLVMGLACTAFSVLLFVGASLAPPALAHVLFLVGQALQGAYPAELLGSIVCTDISNEPGADIVAIGALTQVMGSALGFLVELTAVALTSAELTHFGTVWAIVAAVNLVLAVGAVRLCRETKPNFGEEAPASVTAGVGNELAEYASLLRGSLLLRLNLCGFALHSLAGLQQSIGVSFLLSQHGISQGQAAQWFFPQGLLGIMCIKLVPMLCERLGEDRGFVVIVLGSLALDVLLVPFFAVGVWAMLAHAYGLCLLSGMGPLVNAIDSKWFDARVTAKFLSLKNLVSYGVGVVGNPLYAMLFDAKAKTYFGGMKPYLLSLACRCLQSFVLLVLCWDVGTEGGLRTVLDSIKKARLEKEAEEKGKKEE